MAQRDSFTLLLVKETVAKYVTSVYWMVMWAGFAVRALVFCI
jgi:hypothetical protein